jgi:hypothetical protein
MARWRQAVELAMTDEDIEKLTAIARSRSEAARRVARAQTLLAYREKSSFFAVGQRLGLHHQTVQRCVERTLADVPLTALDDRPRQGKGCKMPVVAAAEHSGTALPLAPKSAPCSGFQNTLKP